MAMEINTTALDSESEQRIRDLGHVTMTEDAKDIIDENELELVTLFERYVKGDYGDTKHEDAWNNDVAMYQRRGQVKAVYTTKTGRKLSILTHWCVALTQIEEVE